MEAPAQGEEVSDLVVAPSRPSDLGAVAALSGPILGVGSSMGLVAAYQLWPHATEQFMNTHLPIVTQLSYACWPPDHLYAIPGLAIEGFFLGTAAEVLIGAACFAAGSTCAYVTRRCSPHRDASGNKPRA